MCGITGYHGFGDSIDLDEMVEQLRHRGPDERGSIRDGDTGLGCSRLSIVDPGGGSQPLDNEDGTVWTVFNGEIYNHGQLRDELRERGHRFHTEADTEVIVHGYEEWGEGCFERLRGMYAIAIWDGEAEKLVLGRDRVGKKPLYYIEEEGRVIFGSEIKAILASGEYEPELEKGRLRQFLAYGYTTAPGTLFRGVRKLRPGEVLSFRDGSVERTMTSGGTGLEEGKDSAADLRSVLEKNMEERTRRGESYSVFLSGGIDSVTTLSLLSGQEDVEVRAYTAAFPGSKFDETGYAEAAADHFGVDHRVVEMEPDAVRMIPEMVEHFDDLMADQANVPYHALASRASSHSRVAFTGSGGDELFGGYEHHRMMDLGDRYLSRLPARTRRAIPPLTRKIPDRLLEHFFPYVRELGPAGWKRFSEYIESAGSEPEAYEKINAMMTGEEIDQVLDEEIDGEITDTGISGAGTGAMRWGIRYEQQKQLPAKNLMKTDKTGMAHGLEVRSPLLSERTLEFSRRMQDSRFSAGEKKVLKQAMDDIPERFRERRKQRLLMPIHEWLADEGAWTVEELEERHGLPPALDRSEVEKVVDGLDSSPLYYARQLWNIAHFVAWYDRYID